MFKVGDKVIMNDQYEVSEADKGRVWIVESEPWECCYEAVVLLKGEFAAYPIDGLDLVESE